MSVIDEISFERSRQITQEGWSEDHDDFFDDEFLALAAASYAANGKFPSHAQDMWPFDEEFWKPTDRRRDLIKAAALIVAEIERLDRRTTKASAP